MKHIKGFVWAHKALTAFTLLFLYMFISSVWTARHSPPIEAVCMYYGRADIEQDLTMHQFKPENEMAVVAGLGLAYCLFTWFHIVRDFKLAEAYKKAAQESDSDWEW